MKRAYTLKKNKDEDFICEFHPTYKHKINCG